MLGPLLRELTPQVVAAVTRRYGDFAAAEDAVQEALVAAAQQWPASGLPDDPRAWLIHVASRRMLDHVRSETARRRREQDTIADAVDRVDPVETTAHEDDMLTLLYMCCHPALTQPSAIALTLRAVGGLTTLEIANAFLVPESTMAQRISRAKQTVKKSGVGFEMPSDAERGARLTAVLHVLYLIFNEGYAASSGPQLARVDLSSEAIRLAREVRRQVPGDREVTGLLALMLLTDARRAARTGPGGELVTLDDQDRSLWDRALIAEGTQLIEHAFAGGAPGPYQLQAAIAAVHDAAPSTDETDWAEIAGLYGVLLQLTDNPMVRLSRAIAIAMLEGPERGLALIDELDGDERVRGHYRLDAVRGHLHERAGDRVAAIRHYVAAAARTTSVPERNYLVARAARLES
ncbi:MAG: sigma-70 family RNA polymerase sigma factor [Deltaproteobacteria bacterium]|nr:sigma-70 family RNA polymerase sigma factor [Deltaproteobacteria bacterium]